MKKIILALVLALNATFMFAVPVKPGQRQTLKLADGSTVRAEMVGDEFCHYWLGVDGKGYAWSENAGCYTVIDLTTVNAQAQKLRSSANARRQTRATNGKPGNYIGERKGLIILVEFPKRTSTNTPAKQFKTENARDFYDKVANQENFSDPVGFTESVYDYFYAQSSGKFKFKFDVVGPYKLGNDYTYYGQDNGSLRDAHLGRFIYDACKKADNDVNFADYDWDGDGTVDQVFVLYAGQGQNVNTADPNLIWPQEGSLKSVGSDQAPFQMDGVTIDTYACSCELGQDETIDGIGTICHEFSHCFGVPDMYDKGSSFSTGTELKYGTYVWDLMNTGNYLNGGYTPAGYTAYERMFCGWKQPIVLEQDVNIEGMKPLSEDGDTYIIYNDNHQDEYFLLENRQQTGCDAALYGKGLMITHINYSAEAWEANDVNTTRERYELIAADNSKLRTVESVQGDLYPYRSNNSFTNTSTPSAKLANANTDGSYLLNKEVIDITQNADGTISFKFRNKTVTGIHEVQADKNVTYDIYDLNGRNLGAHLELLPNGIYIRNGKKIIK